MIFGFFKGREEEVEEEEVELVLFQGPLNGKEINLAQNARLAQAGLIPAKEMVTDALARRAEMIRLDPKGDRSSVTLMVDGVPYPGGRMAKQQGAAITQMMKLLAGLDVRLRGRPQSGGLKAEFEGTPYELLVDIAPLQEGAERLTVRARNLKQKLETPEELGFNETIKAKIRELTGKKQGLLLVCGSPNSGTTTTTYGVLRGIDVYLYSIYSIAKTERLMLNITPFESNPGDDLKTTLGRVLRVEAEVILMDPLRDAETAKTAFEFADRVCIITEFTAKDAANGIAQLAKWVEDPKQVAEGLSGVFSQKLIRLLCTSCRQAYRPNPKLLSKVGLPDDCKVLYRKPVPLEGQPPVEPCDKCGGIGYYGRASMLELIEMTSSMRELVAGGAAPDAIKAQARKEGMPTLQKDGLRLVAEGRTSLEELQRVFKAASA